MNRIKNVILLILANEITDILLQITINQERQIAINLIVGKSVSHLLYELANIATTVDDS